ncbi:GNAT family N-acetyltransferase [Photobacterium halotolerans]|uniref:Aerobactin siderophore synthesis protein IucB n=1 Tax=Photobacterium halotolerans TaxID=265726 RepID=A0A0F5VD41_9GAMM|nr:GNAT family N-acetyltransferase [Photobacterium halotolerans]KKC99711.1 aerobactin siderophore synthesis protein IucB [Photobacterium halotolerans]
MFNAKTFQVVEGSENPLRVQLTLSKSDLVNPQVIEQLIADLDGEFSQQFDCQCFQLEASELILAELAKWLPLCEGAVLYKALFYQMPAQWHRHTVSSRFPLIEVQSNNQYRHHPMRPAMPTGTVYQRFDHQADLEVSFRVFDMERDLDRFVRWMNDPRVAHFWEQAWSKDDLAEFAQSRLNDPHIIPLIGEFNGEAFGYVEAYWVSEDRLSPYYDVQSYDRGIHLLVGEDQFRGPRYFNCWMRAISHYLFIDDVRTTRIVLEPRSDNKRLFNRIKEVGYQKLFEFNFPHKRSALLMLERGAFFEEQW